MKVFVTRQFPPRCIKQLKDAGFSVEMWDSDDPVDYNYMLQKSADVDAILCTLSDKLDENFFNHAKNLKVVSTMSVGFDHIDIAVAKKRNIKVGNTPGYLGDAIAELAVGILLSVTRKIFEGAAAVKNGTWGAWKPYWLCGHSLQNSTVGIVGLGNIGKGIAKRLKPFGVKQFYAFDLFLGEFGKDIEVEPNLLVKLMDFDDLLTHCDFVLTACTLNEKTKNLFNKAAFSKMKPTAVFVNISRGPVVDQDALFAALKEKKIGGAGLDVTVPEPLPVDHPLLTLPNCVILPHIGSATMDTRDVMSDLSVTNLLNAIQGKEMVSEIKS